MLVEQVSVIVSICMMAFALSMDAFSVSLSIGMQNLRLKRIAIIGFLIGILHVILPFVGIVIGHYVSEKVTFITELTGGFILIVIGAHMFFSALQAKSYEVPPQQGWKLLIVAFFVSIDSFPAGLSIGFASIDTFLIISSFGLCSMVMSWLGMLIGKKVHARTGKYSEMLGGVILHLIGLMLVFH